MDQTRELRFEGIPNCRDLGGIRTKDGRVVREGLLLRSAHLARATSALPHPGRDSARMSRQNSSAGNVPASISP